MFQCLDYCQQKEKEVLGESVTPTACQPLFLEPGAKLQPEVYMPYV